MDVGTSRSTSCSVSRYSNPWRPSGGAYGGRGEALLNGKPCHRIFPPSPASRLFRNRLAIRTTNTGSLLRTAVHQPFFFFLFQLYFILLVPSLQNFWNIPLSYPRIFLSLPLILHYPSALCTVLPRYQLSRPSSSRTS